MRTTTLSLLLLLALAGCGAPPPEASDGFEDLDFGDVAATETTGVIRGVVVDEAIRPIAGADVQLRGNGVERAANTGPDGLFGFDGLAPGAYFLTANRPGYGTSQASSDVVAGVDEPPVVKLLLAINPSTLPYAVQHKWEGYLECGLSVVALCGVGTDVPILGNVTNDRFNAVVTIDGIPLLVQSEAVWQTTTAASNELWLWHSSATKTDGSFNGTRNSYAWRQGPSPLVMTSNSTEIAESEFGTNNDLYLRMFTGSISGTRNPLDPDGCYPGGPGPDVYCGGVGYSIAQSFTVYTTQFFGYLPPEGWLFAEANQIPPPA